MKRNLFLMTALCLFNILSASEIPEEILKPQLNSPTWPSVTPAFGIYKKPLYAGPFFQGKKIGAPKELTGEALVFTKNIELDEKAISNAYLQYFSDSGVVFATLNGSVLSKCGNPSYPAFCNVTAKVKAGTNELSFTVDKCDAHVTGELFVRYEDGTFSRFSTDEGFTCSTDASSWLKVEATEVVRPLSDENINRAYFPYHDMERAQKHFVKGAVLPEVARAGEAVQLHFDFQGPIPRQSFSATLSIRSRKSNYLIWDEKVIFTTEDLVVTGQDTWQLSAKYTLPLYVDSADATIRLEANEFLTFDSTSATADFRLERIDVDPRFAEKSDMEVRQTANGPQFFRNGEPFFALWGGVDRFRRIDKKLRFGDMPLQALQIEADQHDTWWLGLDKYWLETFDRVAELARRENPDAYFIINLLIYPPGEWRQKYPEEMCLQSDGKIPNLGRIQYSISSDQALKDMKAAMTAAIEHMENSCYANRIIGYKINSGDTTEWLAHRYADGTSVDFSKPSVAKFKAYAAKHYPELKDVSIPLPEEREALDDGELMRQVDKNLKTVAFNRFYSFTNAEFMLSMCREAKKLVKNSKLIGTYYGYSFMVASDCYSQLRAHGALKHVLDAGVLDFLMSPQCYSNRNFGDTCGDMKPFASLQSHNIIPIIEDDTRTHNGQGAMDGAYYYCQTITPQQTVAITSRNMAIAICRNEPNLFYSLCAGYDQDFPEAVEEGRKLRITGEYAVQNAVKRNAEAAIVVSEEAFMAAPTLPGPGFRHNVQLQQLYMPDGSIYTHPQTRVDIWGETLDQNLTRFARAGAPTDYLLAEDLADETKEYKIYFFLNCYNYDEKFLKAVEKLRKRDCVLVWLYAPGYSKEKQSGVEYMKMLTGFDIQKEKKAIQPLIQFTDGRAFASPIPTIKPMFAVNAADGAQVLGRYPNGQTAYAVKKTGKATSIFYGLFRLDVPVIQEMLRTAGAFVYSDTSDPMEANEHFVTLHARFDGLKTIHLPEKADVLDIMNRRIVARDTDNFQFEAPLHSTWFFYYGKDADKLLEELNRQ